MPTGTARTVYFIRHGTSEWNLLGKWQGQTDTLLAPEGEAQAKRAGAQLLDSGVRFDAMRCSDLKRAHRTAILLAAVCGNPTSLEVLPDVRLRECSLGCFEGQHKNDIFGPRYSKLFRRLAALPHEARIRTAYFPELETPLEIATRALAAARELAASVPPGGTVALVTHSVIIESLCAAAFHKDFESVHTQTYVRLDIPRRPLSDPLLLSDLSLSALSLSALSLSALSLSALAAGSWLLAPGSRVRCSRRGLMTWLLMTWPLMTWLLMTWPLMTWLLMTWPCSRRGGHVIEPPRLRRLAWL
jgi:broad specificity phosphatase PhoE